VEKSPRMDKPNPKLYLVLRAVRFVHSEKHIFDKKEKATKAFSTI